MLLKIVLQMKNDPELQEAFLRDPEEALAQCGVSEEERAILLCGDEERVCEAIAHEVVHPGELDLEGFPDEVRQDLTSGDKKRIKKHLTGQSAPSFLSRPAWIYVEGSFRASRSINGIDPASKKRGSPVTITCYGSYFEAAYAGVQLRHTTSAHIITGSLGAVSGPNQKSSSVQVTFNLAANTPAGAYRLFVRTMGAGDYQQASTITFRVDA
jgi:hypothetical protein